MKKHHGGRARRLRADIAALRSNLGEWWIREKYPAMVTSMQRSLVRKERALHILVKRGYAR